MYLAHSPDNPKLEPFKGGIASCPICKADVRAYCGDVNIDHWRHISKEDCEGNWKEAETPWHRNWKLHFPLKNREVIVSKNGKMHRADVKLDNGLVIEFQNSPISQSTILAREKHYDKMIWVINANHFKENLSFNSNLAIYERNLEIDQRSYFESYDEPSQYKKSQNTLDYIEELNETFEICKLYLREISEIRKELNQVRVYAGNLAHSWENYLKANIQGITGSVVDFSLDSFLRKTYYELITESNKYHNKLKSKIYGYEARHNFQNCHLNGYENYIIIKDYKIPSNLWGKCKIVRKGWENTIFPEFIHFTSEADFSRMRYNKDVDILFDNSRFLELYVEDIQFLKIKLAYNKLQQRTIKKFVKISLKSIFKQRKIDLEHSLSKLIKDYYPNRKNYYWLKNKITELDIEDQQLHEKYLERKDDTDMIDHLFIKQGFANESNHQKHILKDQFLYYWKYRRNSWNESKAIKFLEIDNILYRLNDDSHATSYTINQFLKWVKLEIPK